MGRGKKSSNIVQIEKLDIHNRVEIDYDKLALAIIKSNEALENIKRRQVEEIENGMQQKRKEILGEKDFTYIKIKLLA